jgi:hypothetical protein
MAVRIPLLASLENASRGGVCTLYESYLPTPNYIIRATIDRLDFQDPLIQAIDSGTRVVAINYQLHAALSCSLVD